MEWNDDSVTLISVVLMPNNTCMFQSVCGSLRWFISEVVTLCCWLRAGETILNYKSCSLPSALSASSLSRLLVSVLFWGLDSSLVLFISPSNSHRTSQSLRERTKVGNCWLALMLQSLQVCSLRVTVGIPRLSRTLGALTWDRSLLTTQLIACIRSLCLKETGNLYGMKPISPCQGRIRKSSSQSGSH